MHVKVLSLKDFRNYEALTLRFEPGVHLFIGENAQGKTNLLESLVFLSLCRSYRTSKDKELIRWGSNRSFVYAEVEKMTGTVTLELQLAAGGKKVKLNGLERRRLSEYIGAFNVVIFAPEDLDLIKGSPTIRRRFIDLELGQISPSYLYHTGQYQKVLSQRNALLKEFSSFQEHLYDIFTHKLIEHGVKICQKRFQFVRKLNQWAAQIHSQITQGREELLIRYQPSAPLEEGMDEADMFASFVQQFAAIKEKERERGTTLLGPHRDDLQLFVNGENVHIYGSQGQQRTAALALKLAELELIKGEKGEYPVLLLDDVLSELDDSRRSHLIRIMGGKVQTFVTSTSLEGIDKALLEKAYVYRVKAGQIVTETNPIVS